MTDEEIAERVGGAYHFARNILCAVVMDMIDEGAEEARIERLLQRIDEQNESAVSPRVRALLSNQMETAYAALLRSRPDKADPSA
jgi:hypothetical protein